MKSLVLVTAFALVLPVGAAGADDDADVAAASVGRLTEGVGLEQVGAVGLASDIAAPPGDDRLFVAELKAGRIRVVKNGSALATPFLDISSLVQTSANEQGLLGIAFPPDYAESGLFYVHYSSKAGNGDTAVVEYSVSGNPDIADAGSARILLTANQPSGNHNGGSIQIGPDGYLYIGLGDGGGGGDPWENGQDTGTLLGSILRIDPATGDAAPGNPFIGGPGADKIWHYGLRNPWRFSFDAATGDMYIGDVGQGAREEVDVAPAGVGGLNFGWDRFEGSLCYEGPCGSKAGLTFPVHEYSHRSSTVCGNPGGSITGGYVYRGNELPWLRGHYFYADWCLGDLGSFRANAKGNAVQHIDWTDTLSIPKVITSFGVDGYGELHFTSGGRIYKFVNERNPECDFHGDGYGDVVVGVPGEGHSGAPNAGIVMLFPGSSSGVAVTGGESYRQGVGVVGGSPEANDGFASSLACGDFNGDGRGDLAVGVPFEGAGGVHVLYGGANGLSDSGSDYWTKQSLGLSSGGSQFGHALATGDVDRDGYDELVVGSPLDSAAGPSSSGAVALVYGSSSGLTADGAMLVHQNRPGIRNTAQTGDFFGYSVAVGDVDGDGFGDVIAGVPGETVAGSPAAGAVAVVFGKASGLGKRDVLVDRSSPGIKKPPTTNAAFGVAVAAGRFDLDGFDDIAVGVSRPGLAGEAHLIYGKAGGPSKRDRVFSQEKGGIGGSREPGDEFASVLAVGDANGDGFDDLAIGVPGEDHNGKQDGGIVGVLYGSTSGLDDSTYEVWHQGKPGIKGAVGSRERFGAALRFVDVRGDDRLDLVIGSPRIGAGGSISVIPGKAPGLSPGGDQLWSQDTPGVGGTAEPNDRFGGAV